MLSLANGLNKSLDPTARKYQYPPAPGPTTPSDQTRIQWRSPNVSITPEQVDELKRQDVSWRRIGKVLGIGTATAMRLFKSLEGARPNTQDVRPKNSW